MKKLLIIIAVLAMVASFLPKAQAGENAILGLKVTFEIPNEPLKIWCDPEGPFGVKVGETLEFDVIAEDPDSEGVTLSAVSLPEGAEFWPIDMGLPGPRTIRQGRFHWIPKFEQSSEAPRMAFIASFEAKNAEGEAVKLDVEITVSEGAVISIELSPTSWVLEGVKLGERRSNLSDDGTPIHNIANTGNVSVMVDIGYAVQIDSGIRPGLEQGIDTFITIVGESVLPPNERVQLGIVVPDETKPSPLPLTYGAPTEVSGIGAHGVAYELRAYGIIPPPPPVPLSE